MEEKEIRLPENANRPLKEGEEYKPILPADQDITEITPYSVSMGVLMAIIFSAAAAYLGLKVGQVFEAAIPIAIIAVGLSSALKRKNGLAENVIIQSIGSSSGVIVAGAIFTLPALYILQAKYPDMTVTFLEVFMSSLLGGCLGILFLIPFRRYFVKEKHGEYPFPEATATTQVLIAGASSKENSSQNSKILVVAALIGGVYDFLVSSLGLWKETISTRLMGWGEVLAQKLKLTFSINTGAALLGLGYIIGLKYAVIICSGSLFVWWVILPLIGTIGGMESVDPQTLFLNYGRNIGIGAIAMAGLIGIIKNRSVIGSAFSLVKQEFGKGKQVAEEIKRTDRDLSMKFLAIAIVVALVCVFVFFMVGVLHNFVQTIVAFLVVTIIAFLFTTVAANAIAIVGTNPVSGMTLMTLIIASLVLVAVGLKGNTGMAAALIIGGVVCTALSMAGSFVTDLKIGYWIGTTPKKQEMWKFLGTLVSAVTVGGVMIVLNKTYGFVGNNALQAPQANAMAAVIEPLMSGQGAPWMLYGVGAILALLLNFLNVPVLAFALGMFIPLHLNTPLLVGGAVNYFVNKKRERDGLQAEELANKRNEKGTLIASGFIAGGALMGVVSAIIKFCGVDLYMTEWEASNTAGVLSLVMYVLLTIYFVWSSNKVQK